MNNYDSGNSANYNRKQKEKYENDEFELKTSGHTESVWYEDIPQSMKFDKLKRNISPSESIDVAIVGGGIAGLLTAYIFQNRKKSSFI